VTAATAGILIASLFALAGWAVLRRRTSSTPSHGIFSRAAAASTGPRIDSSRLETAGRSAAQRLWRVAFGVPAETTPLPRAHQRVRDLICAVLQVDALDPNYFPRRPTLMPQLLQAVDDPNAASEKLSRMIAHDPVLTADVLRLANSSLYRIAPAPIETIQRAIVVCGVDALRGILATAMLRPVFRASRSNFPRLPRMLWDRTERAARAAELYAAKSQPQDRFEAQLLVLLSALGPLVVYSAALDGYSRAPRLTPNPMLFAELIDTLGLQMSQRIARDWQTSARLLAALDRSGEEGLATALHVGELLGTLSLLESQAVITRDERIGILKGAQLSGNVVDDIWARIAGNTH
jgi:HD-like signal output (HDOD) protein